MKVRLTNLVLTTSPVFAITCDGELDGTLLPSWPMPPPPVPVPTLPPDPGPGPSALPNGWNTDKAIGLYMLVTAMTEANLTPIGVQKHGDQIIAALKASYPDLDVYLSSTDSPIWPGFGSLDVTVDSGKKGWSFRPDGYFPWQPVGQR